MNRVGERRKPRQRENICLGGLTLIVAPDIALVDLLEQQKLYRTAGYFIAASEPAIIETGSVRSVETWLNALEQKGIPLDEIAYIIVTHVHLDHAGGAGTLARYLPRAKVVVHPRGARHLVDPSRLIQGARAVYGDQLEKLWGIPEPVPENRILVGEPDTHLNLGSGHRLRIFNAPGHAAHQFMLLDESNGAMFAADELGICYRLPQAKNHYVLPVTSPNQYNPAAMLQSVSLVGSIRPEVVLLTHFGPVDLALEQLLVRLQEQIRIFTDAGAPGDRQKGSPELVAEDTILKRLLDHVRADLEAQEIEWSDEVEALLLPDLRLSALGIADYWAKRAGTT